jgi:hypothetical protein
MKWTDSLKDTSCKKSFQMSWIDNINKSILIKEIESIIDNLPK